VLRKSQPPRNAAALPAAVRPKIGGVPTWKPGFPAIAEPTFGVRAGLGNEVVGRAGEPVLFLRAVLTGPAK
jgi:hypothetical protein